MNKILAFALADIETERVRIDRAQFAAKARFHGVLDRINGAVVQHYGVQYKITESRMHDNARIYCGGVRKKKDGKWGARTFIVGYLDSCKWIADP